MGNSLTPDLWPCALQETLMMSDWANDESKTARETWTAVLLWDGDTPTWLQTSWWTRMGTRARARTHTHTHTHTHTRLKRLCIDIHTHIMRRWFIVSGTVWWFDSERTETLTEENSCFCSSDKLLFFLLLFILFNLSRSAAAETCMSWTQL